MLSIDIIPDVLHPDTFSTAWTDFDIGTFKGTIIFAHPDHPNFNFRDVTSGFLTQGSEKIDGNNSVAHLKLTSDVPLINTTYSPALISTVVEDFIPLPNISVADRKHVFVVPVGQDCILMPPTSYQWGDPESWHNKSNQTISIIWEAGSLSDPKYKIVSDFWENQSFMSYGFDWSGYRYISPLGPTTSLGHLPYASEPATSRAVICSRLRWVSGSWIQESAGYDQRFMDGDYMSLPLYRGLDHLGRFLEEDPFLPMINPESLKKRVRDVSRPFLESSLSTVAESSSGFYQSLYSAVNGVQTYNIMSLLFIKDTIGMIKDISYLAKQPERSLKRLLKSPAYKNVANLFLGFKYGVMTEASDINHVISKTNRPLPIKKKSYGTAFDNAPIFGPSVMDLTTRYQVNLRYRDGGSNLDSLVTTMRNLGLFVDFNTLWEVTRFSFVIDWFSNLGQLATSLDAATYGIANEENSTGVWDDFSSNILGIIPTSLTFSYKSEGTYDTSLGRLTFSMYHRVPLVSMPYLPMVYDFELHSGYTKHVSELSALLIQRLPR